MCGEALDVVPSGDRSPTHFFQCVLHNFLILNTNDKSKLEKMCRGIGPEDHILSHVGNSSIEAPKTPSLMRPIFNRVDLILRSGWPKKKKSLGVLISILNHS